MGRNLPDPFALRQTRQLTSVVRHCRGRVVFFAICIFWIPSPALLAHSFTGQVERVIDPPQAVASRRAGGDRLNCFTGTVTRVVDGDTVVVLAHDSEVPPSLKLRKASGIRVRLAEIDAPEMKTGFGPASKAVLSDMILHKQVAVTWKRRGRYRRIIGQVYADGEWVNLSMVAQGWAWQFRRYSRSKELAAAEREARARKVGVWRVAEHSALAVAAADDVQEMTRGR